MSIQILAASTLWNEQSTPVGVLAQKIVSENNQDNTRLTGAHFTLWVT